MTEESASPSERDMLIQRARHALVKSDDGDNLPYWGRRLVRDLLEVVEARAERAAVPAEPDRIVTYTHCTGGSRFRQRLCDPLPPWAYDVREEHPLCANEGPETSDPDTEFGLAIGEYARSCWHHDQAGMRSGYIKLRDLCRAAVPASVVPAEIQAAAFELLRTLNLEAHPREEMDLVLVRNVAEAVMSIAAAQPSADSAGGTEEGER